MASFFFHVFCVCVCLGHADKDDDRFGTTDDDFATFWPSANAAAASHGSNLTGTNAFARVTEVIAGNGVGGTFRIGFTPRDVEDRDPILHPARPPGATTEWTSSLAHDASAADVKAALEQLPSVQLVEVSRGIARTSGHGGDSSLVWDVTFVPHDASQNVMTSNGGDLPLLQADASDLFTTGGLIGDGVGNGASVNVSTLQDGTPTVSGKFKILFRDFYYRWDEMRFDETAEVINFVIPTPPSPA